jgi:hypothetical protein
MADGHPRYLSHHCPTGGIKLPNRTSLNVIRIQVQELADDFVLSVPTVEELQVLVDSTQKWCELLGMRLNGVKTRYLSINPDPHIPGPPTPLEVAGVNVPPVEEVKHLGLYFHTKEGLQESIKHIEQRFWVAWEEPLEHIAI